MAAAATFALAAAGVDSCKVPHEPHSGQRPSHLGDTYPHSEHVWIGRCFLAMVSYSSRPVGQRSSRGNLGGFLGEGNSTLSEPAESLKMPCGGGYPHAGHKKNYVSGLVSLEAFGA